MVCKPLESSYTSPHSGLYIQQNKPGKLYGGAFLYGAPRRKKSVEIKRHSRPLIFFLATNRLFCNKKTWRKATTIYSCDGHNDCGAGCLCLWCYLLDGISKGAWLNRSSIIFAGNDKWSVDPRVSIVSSVGDKHEYSLQIQKVDVTDDGQYTCSIQSERNPRPKLLNLIVKVPPKIYDISSDITVNEGSNVSLICTASGKPEPSISWRHITPLARKYDSGEYLNITGITRDQAGDYECSALNDIASPDTKTVKVTVNFAPAIHEMKSHGVGLGRTALLRCEAAAVPSPTFEWYKGEKRIIKGQGIDIKSLSSRSVLTVTNMTEDRYGNYTCVASNNLGTANASVPLIPPNTAPYGSTGSAHVPLACRYLVLALSSFISVY
ncbi:neuronal growth regulator 1 isoform X2 [Thunnus maccoyii]|uniref:neuronal growth regulator 1 isoform X2 n=1 Tax=Thunnus maccoyii TaxID=8240 RepID=UPI001C4C6ED1|nr:neuronal growth regulator 1 isoform X2 [Thunnus maccoyii]